MLMSAEGIVVGMVTSAIQHALCNPQVQHGHDSDEAMPHDAIEKRTDDGGIVLGVMSFSTPLIAFEELLTDTGVLAIAFHKSSDDEDWYMLTEAEASELSLQPDYDRLQENVTLQHLFIACAGNLTLVVLSVCVVIPLVAVARYLTML
jgi:hypothetical protein